MKQNEIVIVLMLYWNVLKFKKLSLNFNRKIVFCRIVLFAISYFGGRGKITIRI